jgi:iron-sulfur cluster assembly protein
MGITLTESAATHVKGLIASRGRGEGLRLGLTRSGCSGFAYVVDFADAIEDGDRVFESNGVKVVVSDDNLAMLDGMVVDYVRDGLNSMFRFDNPNARSACGCGESVGF